MSKIIVMSGERDDDVKIVSLWGLYEKHFLSELDGPGPQHGQMTMDWHKKICPSYLVSKRKDLGPSTTPVSALSGKTKNLTL